nr:neuronal acetylcholine receptor subunit alpha-7-like [Biomphalaria glabrata]
MLKRLISTVCCFSCLDLVTADVNSSFVQDYERLMADLLKRPALVHRMPADLFVSNTEPVDISVTLYLAEVVQVDQVEQLVTIACLLYIGWTHKGLAWDVDNYSTQAVLLDTEHMWLPQIGVWVGYKESMAIDFPVSLLVNASGFVSCKVVGYVTFRCKIDVQKYPFDTQSCNFGIYYFEDGVQKVPFKMHLNGLSDLQENVVNNDPYSVKGEWTLVNFTVAYISLESGDQIPYFVLTMRRQRLYYVIVVIFPLVLTSVMIPLVFLIPEKSGEQMSYMATIFTSTAIFLSYISNVMPKSLSSTPFLAILLTEVLIEGFCATLAILWVVRRNAYMKKTQRHCQTLEGQVTLAPSDELNVKGQSQVSPASTSPLRQHREVQSRDIGQYIFVLRCQLDFCLFFLLLSAQIVFLVCLLFATDWLRNQLVLDSEEQRNRDSEEQRHRGTETQRNRDTEEQRLGGTEVQRLGGTETQRPAHGYSDSNITAYGRLRNDILSRDAVVHRVPPNIADPTRAVNMTYNLVLFDVMDIDQVRQLMTVCLYLRVEWTQLYLAWEPSLYNNITKVNIETRSLWTPYLMIVVGFGERLSLEYPEWAYVISKGSVLFHFETFVTFRCSIDFRKYPFDTQTCKMGIIAITELTDPINIRYNVKEKEFDPTPYVTNGEWRLISYQWKISNDTNDLSFPMYSIKVQRRPEYYVITIVAPLILASVMMSFVFLIPPGSGEKISFFVTLFTSLTIFLSFVGNVMPRNLSSAPYLILLLIGVYTQGLLANLATLFVVNTYHKEKKQTNRCECRSSRKRGKVAPLETVVEKENLSQDLHAELENTTMKSKLAPNRFCLTSNQWDKLFFVLFTSVEVVLLGALFGATDWLSDAPTLGL